MTQKNLKTMTAAMLFTMAAHNVGADTNATDIKMECLPAPEVRSIMAANGQTPALTLLWDGQNSTDPKTADIIISVNPETHRGYIVTRSGENLCPQYKLNDTSALEARLQNINKEYN